MYITLYALQYVHLIMYYAIQISVPNSLYLCALAQGYMYISCSVIYVQNTERFEMNDITQLRNYFIENSAGNFYNVIINIDIFYRNLFLYWTLR